MPRKPPSTPPATDVLALFHPITADWFRAVFDAPTAPQIEGWPAIARGDSTLILAPTGTGKTLTAFLWTLDKLMLRTPPADRNRGCRVLYISPLKALAVDVDRNLRSPLAGIANMAQRAGVEVHQPEISVRTGDTSPQARARFLRHPGEILITTPESLYLMLTSQAAETLRTIDTVIIDEIHALVPTKRGAHLALSIERLQALTGRPLQRIGLSATQRPLEEVARFLAGANASTTNNDCHSERSEEPPHLSLTEERSVVQEPSLDAEDARTDLAPPQFRPVTIINAGSRKLLDLRIEVPVEDMARMGEIESQPSGPAAQGPKRTSIWASIHPRLLEIVRERTSTLIFVNARRIAERLAGALNDLAGEPIARAHHGSLAAAQRSEIEELLKAGQIKALVCTSSLELGIDMGAIDLVIQIEAPPSVASGMQRIGRAGHQVGAPSSGIIFPKYRADLIACAAVTKAMHEGHVEHTRFLRNPLDVLAQQIVAIIAHPPSPTIETAPAIDIAAESGGPSFAASSQRVGSARLNKTKRTKKIPPPKPDENRGLSYTTLFALIKSSAPFATLTPQVFDGVLDMLAGRYPSDEFAELRPRITWDRTANHLTPREGVKRIAILNGGTIPDRGLYGVFLSGERAKPIRVGELDEEMVFESRTGDTFILGASTWRIEQITHDRVLVSPAPGDPGKMPFWHGDQAGRPLEFGRRIGALIRELRDMPRSAAVSRLTREHDLDQLAAENLLRYLADQELATTVVPDDRNIVIERVRDELGDWRVCVLTPFGSRIHAPWAMAVTARIRAASGPEIETMWSEDGFVVRFPESDTPPAIEQILLEPQEAADLVLKQLGSTALFAAKFREAASRALLLPRRRADGRTPLWQQRKRAYDLLSVASRYPSFPILLEAYRECLRDVFDMPALMEILRSISARQLRIHTVDSRTPSPFASALLFSYVANYIYDGDAPLAERRAQALSIDQEQLRELMGDADLRELLDPLAIAETEDQAQCLIDPYRARTADAIHDLLLRLGDLTRDELLKRVTSPDVALTADRLLKSRRILELRVAGEKRLIAVEDAARYRDALGIPLPPGLPTAFLQSTTSALSLPDLKGSGAPSLTASSSRVGSQMLDSQQAATTDLLRRYARTHGPFTTPEAATRFALPLEATEAILNKLVQSGRVAEGGFRPGGIHREWIDNEILRTIRRKSLARLRKEVEPVEQQVIARLFTHWQGILAPRRGLDALLDVIENLQGAPIPASLLETEILPSRITNYKPSDLDTLIAAGEVTWCGLDPLGERDGRIALYLTEKLPTLWPPNAETISLNQISVIPTEGEAAAEGPAFKPAPPQMPIDHPTLSSREQAILTHLKNQGATFFAQLHEAVGAGYPGETIDALWNLVWRGLITNDGLNALRAYCARPLTSRPAKRVHNQQNFRSRRTTPPTAQGRWAIHPMAFTGQPNPTAWSHAIAHQLLHRYGIVFRETAHAENLPGGFSAIYDVMKALEESGRIRRGFFAADLGATQFALPAALDLLRSLRQSPTNTDNTKPELVILAATDPANPYGTLLRWPSTTTPSDTTNPGAPPIPQPHRGMGGQSREGAIHSLPLTSKLVIPTEGEAAAEGPAFAISMPPQDPNAITTNLTRSVGARVILRDGALIAYLRRNNPNIQVFLPEEDPLRTQTARDLAKFLASQVQSEAQPDSHTAGLLITTVNSTPVAHHPIARHLQEAGFQPAPMGFNLRRRPNLSASATPAETTPA